MQTTSKSNVRYYFEKGEDLPLAVRRILSEQLTQAAQVLGRPGDSLEKAVHEARRCIKRTRSLLRLVKFAIPKAYARENLRLREVGRSLSELRDAHALIQTLDDLQKQDRRGGPDGVRYGDFGKAHEFLQQRETQIRRPMEGGGLDNSVAQLNAARGHIDRLTFAKVDLPGMSKSLYKTVKRGAEALRRAEDEGEAEKFHESRKRAKDLRYQLSLLSELRPDLERYSNSAKELEQLLGDDHNLAVLTDLLGDEFRSLRGVAARRQKELRDEAAGIGSALYGKKQKAWKRRLAASAADR